MDYLNDILPWAQIVLSVILVIVILLQQSGAGLGGALGGNDSGTVFHKKRGLEKILFNTTIVIAILFFLSVFIPLFF